MCYVTVYYKSCHTLVFPFVANNLQVSCTEYSLFYRALLYSPSSQLTYRSLVQNMVSFIGLFCIPLRRNELESHGAALRFTIGIQFENPRYFVELLTDADASSRQIHGRQVTWHT